MGRVGRTTSWSQVSRPRMLSRALGATARTLRISSNAPMASHNISRAGRMPKPFGCSSCPTVATVV
eukprot:7148354-Heterocapsa_arctica.AAC.1